MTIASSAMPVRASQPRVPASTRAAAAPAISHHQWRSDTSDSVPTRNTARACDADGAAARTSGVQATARASRQNSCGRRDMAALVRLGTPVWMPQGTRWSQRAVRIAPAVVPHRATRRGAAR